VDQTAGEVLDYLLERSGVLREPVRDRVDFVHRTFQECLAANEATEQDYLDVLVDRAHRDTWWETIVMACGHAKSHQVDEILSGVLDRAEHEPRHARHLRLLAAACLETVSNADPEVIRRVESVIQDKLVPPRNIRETQSLASIGPRVLRYLPDTLEGLSDAVAGASVRAAALTAGNDALKVLQTYARDPRGTVQEQLMHAWQYFDPEVFAREVLAESPLNYGYTVARTARLLPYVGLLGNLTNLSISLPSSEPQADLGFVTGLPHLKWLSAHFRNDVVVTLDPLAEHPGLTTVILDSALCFTGLAALRRLEALETLYAYPQRPWRDLEFLRSLTRLSMLSIDELQDVPGLGPLADLEKLDKIRMWNVTPRTFSDRVCVPAPTEVWLALPEPGVNLEMITRTFPSAVEFHLHNVELGDLTPIADRAITVLHMDSCHLHDLKRLRAVPTLREVVISDSPEPVDVSPLAEHELVLKIRNSVCTGLGELGPGVTVRTGPDAIVEPL
jgi:hypothetical protein